MHKSTSLLALCLFTILMGCNEKEYDVTPQKGELLSETTRSINENDLMSGTIRVKFSNDVGDLIVPQSNGKNITKCGVSPVDKCLANIGAVSMKRVFPYAGKFEERTKKEGLHLWYDIDFDKTKSVTTVCNEFKNIQGVEIVEKRYKVEAPIVKFIVANTPDKNENAHFNDPLLPSQWHYENKGDNPSFAKDADINLINAWKIETGKRKVIVSVVDGGIDWQHEDLKDNMWINEAELNGVKGKDDDGNGKIDDIYGYNFLYNKSELIPHDHGTHVAGTVAARNNNGKGVCGVAGGDGSKESGVRLMSCQVFGDNGAAGGHSEAIKYGADNGAVISQNSWGYQHPGPGYILESDKAAIDYFIKYAGCDNKGNQLPNSPMKGGVVIFATGNYDSDYKAYPAAYSPVVSVSAMAPDFKKAWYTNRGDWVTIMAPGGDQYYSYPKGMVLSTYPNNKYGYMQGTSMACPHVSGTAALIVSKYGGEGFTNNDLKSRLVSAFKPYDIDEKNPNYKGRLGAGYLDAEKALLVNKNIKPSNITNTKIETSCDYINISWSAVKDEDDKTASFYLIYYSKNELTASNLSSAKVEKVKGMGYSAGDAIKYKLEELDLNTNYYFAIVAQDRWGLVSEKPYFFKGKTLENFAPKVKVITTKPIRITETEEAVVNIEVSEPEGQEWSYKLSGTETGVTANVKDSIISVTFSTKAKLGKHTLKVSVLDIFKAETSVEIPFEVYENNPPKLVSEFGKVFTAVNKEISIDLNNYFKEIDGHTIKYEASSNNTSVANVSLNGNVLKIIPSSTGNGAISVNATDIHGANTRTSFDIQVTKDEIVYTAYPIPVATDFYIRLNDKITNSTVKILTTTGTVVYKQNYTTSTTQERLLKLNLSKISGGTYVLSVEANGENYQKSFVKL